MEQKKEIYTKAKKKVEELKGFYTHLTMYALINLFLLFVNIINREGGWWFYWPLFGWGIGVVFHAVNIQGFFLGEDWEEKKIEELVGKEKEKTKEIKDSVNTVIEKNDLEINSIIGKEDSSQ